MGKALSIIRDKRLDRTYGTFEEYCLRRWDLERRTAYQLMDAAAVMENVRNCAHFLPANEAQARPLAQLKNPEQQNQAYKKSRVIWATLKHHSGVRRLKSLRNKGCPDLHRVPRWHGRR